MGTLDKVMSKAYRMKEDVYGEKPGYLRPRDVHPHMKSWVVSLILTVWAMFILTTFFEMMLVLSIWLVTHWSFFRCQVKL
jgi:hypothetical protein